MTNTGLTLDNLLMTFSGVIPTAHRFYETCRSLRREPHQMEVEVIAKRVLRENFTEEAQDKLKKVVVTFGDSPIFPISGAVAMIKPGVIRVLKPDNIRDITLVHEYLHFADFFGMINHNKFNEAYEHMQKKIILDACVIVPIEMRVSNPRYKNKELPERIAMMGEQIFRNRQIVPRKMRRVYSKVLNGYHK